MGLLSVLAGCGARQAPEAGGDTQRVTIDGRTFDLELALTPATRYQGLSGREQIDKRGGMLFVFPDAGKRSFVMRDCLVPIDLIFLDSQGRVVQTHRMSVPPKGTSRSDLKRYSSRWPAQFVIELKGGLLDQLDIQNGERIPLPLKALKARAK